MKSLLRSFFAAMVPAALLASCATLPSATARTAEVAPEPMKLAMGYDVAFLRVDLKRSTHLVRRFVMELDSNGVMKTQPEPVKVDNPYRYLLVSFGNGLILDRNGNLAIDLLRLYHLDGTHSFSVSERFRGLLPGGRSFVKKGPILTRSGIGIVAEHLSATISGNVVELHGQVFYPHMRIVRSAHSVSLEPAGRRTSSTVTIMQPSPGVVVFPKIGGETTFRLAGPNHITSTGGLDITRVGKRIDIVLRSPGGIEASFVYKKTENGCLVTSSDGYPTIGIERAGNEISITRGGHLAATVTIDSTQK